MGSKQVAFVAASAAAFAVQDVNQLHIFFISMRSYIIEDDQGMVVGCTIDLRNKQLETAVMVKTSLVKVLGRHCSRKL